MSGKISRERSRGTKNQCTSSHDMLIGERGANWLRRKWRSSRGQTMVEFAMMATMVIGTIIGGIQSALIFNAYLALSDLTYQGARYSAVNPGYTSANVISFMQSIASPTLMDNSGANLTITVSPDVTPRAYGQAVSVTVQYSLANKIVVPNPFLGISFPTSIAFTETAMSE